MKTLKKITIATIVMLGICAAIAFGSDTEKSKPMGGHKGPPPEAFTACEGKSAGDTAEFESPRGDKVTGTCVAEGDRLVLRPDSPPDGGRSEKKDD